MKEQSFILPKGPRNFTRLMAFLSALTTTEALKITVGLVKKDRSDPQNNALYGVAYKALTDFTGHSKDELHDIFLRSYFGEVEKTILGITAKVPFRTTTTDEHGKRSKLSTAEFSAFYAHVQQIGAEYGCWVPDPDPMFHFHREERAA